MKSESVGERVRRDVRWPLRLLRCLAPCVALSSFPTDALAFRTSEDSPALSDKGRMTWSAVAVPFLLSDRTLPSGLDKATVEEALARSLDAWIAPECSQIEPIFAGWTHRAPEPLDGDNTIAWVEDWAARGFPSSAPGSTDVQYRGHDDDWQIAETDIYLNASDFDWSTDEGEDTSAQAVLTHELGHALGLLHSCEPEGDDGAPDCEGASSEIEATAMYPFYASSQASLTDDDVAGLCALYPLETACSPGCGRTEECVEGECRATCHEGLCAPGQVCGFWGCGEVGSCLDRDCTAHECDGDVEGTCGPLASCVNGVCEKGARKWGDACRTSPECAVGACVEGVCQPDCEQDTECGEWGECRPTADGAKGCISSGAYEVGRRCSTGEDCETGICVLTEDGNRCTDECESDAACPRNWSCRKVDGQKACVPPPSEGCSLTAVGPTERTNWFWIGAAALAAYAVRRKGKNQ